VARNIAKTPVRVAWATALLSIALGVTLWSAQTGAQMPDEPLTLRPRTAMKQALELFKRRDYENADRLYQQAQAGQAELSASERQDLAELMKKNSNALQGRQDGAVLVQKAQEALQQGKEKEASNLLKAANANQYLTSVDRQMATALGERLRNLPPSAVAGGVTVTQKNGMPTIDTKIEVKGTDAKAFLVAARQALVKGELDFAETLVKDAERVNTGVSSWMPWGDSPTKVRRDIQAARAKQMLPPAVAQAPAEKKDAPSIMSKVGSVLTPPWWRDKKTEDKSASADVKPPEFPATPKDNTAKKTPGGLAQDLSPTAGVAKPPTIDPPAPKLPPSVARAQARKLIDDGYKALQANDLDTARKCADAAKALRPDLDWNERNPDRLLAEIRSKTGTNTNVAAATGAGTPADAKTWIKQARAALQKDQIDDADKLTVKAAAVTSVRWGLFEDSPERLRTDIQEARVRHNREQAAKLMVEARKLYAKGTPQALKEAKDKAFHAKEMHGPYSVWDFSERPQKLLDEIARAEVGSRKAPILPDEIPGPSNPAALAAGIPPRAPVQLMSTSTQQPNRFKATKLIAEARDLERRGFLVEARLKASEADALGVSFSGDEDSPKNVMLSLSSKTDQRIQQLLQQAAELVRNSPNDPTAFLKAEGNITDARKLAQSFQLDPAMINQSAVWLQQAAAKAGVVSPIVAQGINSPGLAPADFKLPSDPQALRSREIGLEKLDKARLEIKAGNHTLARRIAEEAYNPSYFVQVEAGMVLRTIDAEEHQHHTNIALKNYEVGMEAFLRRDFRRAYQLWDTVDLRLLPMDKQRQLAELMQEARSGVAQVKNEVSPATANPGANQNSSGLAKWTAMEEIQTQKLRDRSQIAMNDAWKLVQDKKIPQAVDTLKSFLEDMQNAPVNAERVSVIRRQVESKLNQYNTLLAQQTLDEQTKRAINPESVNNFKIAKLHDEVGELMKDARAKYKEGRYEQALVLAKRAKELDGDSVAVDALIAQATVQVRQREWNSNRDRNEEVNQRELSNDTLRDVSMNKPVSLDKEAHDRASRRKPFDAIYQQTKDPVERGIERKLEMPNSFYWKDAKLDDIIQDLKTLTGINVMANLRALKDANISLDMPMSLNLENVKTKSALNVLLEQAKLTWVIKDQVLQITTLEDAKGKTKSMIHAVADLIVPVDNHQTPECFNLTSALMRHINKNGAIQHGGTSPYMPPNSLPLSSGLPTGHYGNTSTVTGTNASGALPNGAIPNPNTKLLPGQTMETLLMDLIKNTVAQTSWSEQGGPGTIQFYPLGMALVVNQTLEVQEEVAALLAALRRLQDLEIAIEMRLVNVSEAFFERMGLDFDINIKTGHSRGESQLLSGSFTPFGNVNRNLGVKNLVSGLTPAGTLTPDLNVPIKNSSYDFTIPPFGGFPGTIGSDGGLSLGLAFLNDIQVFMFLEAASGDRRTNVMQAPKITLFNGQVATMNVSDNQFFLLDVQIANPNNGNQLFFVPNQAPFPLGVQMTVSAVVSADRRFVRVNLNPQLTNLASATVPLFPVQIVVPQFFDGPGSGSSQNTQPSVFQMFFQQPAFTSISLDTTVNVPDGGTVLLGGLKTLSEARNEFGPPILSKIPYLNRLFRNIGYGRESQSLMIMVTPRIIINEEEEQILLGQIPPIPRP